MKQTGEKLRTVREDKGLSIHEISLSLKINSKVLKAIEEGDTTNLPAKTFLRGFVQSYANYLNMDTNQILNLFQEEMGSTRPQPILNPVEIVAQESTDSTHKLETKPKNETAVAIEKVNAKNQFKAIAISGVMVVLAFLIYLVNAQVERYTKEAQVVSAPNDEDIDDLSPVVETTSPAKEASKHLIEQPTNQTTTTAATAATGTTTSAASVPTTATTTSATKPTTVGTTISTPTATPAPTQALPPPPVKPLTPPKVTTTPPPSPTPSPPPAPASAIAPPPVSKPLPPIQPPAATTASPTPPKVMNVELIVEALEPLEIQYATNAEATTFNKIQLKAEQVHTFKSKNGLTLNLSNGGAANLILNGKDLGVPGKQGQSIQLKY